MKPVQMIYLAKPHARPFQCVITRTIAGRARVRVHSESCKSPCPCRAIPPRPWVWTSHVWTAQQASQLLFVCLKVAQIRRGRRSWGGRSSGQTFSHLVGRQLPTGVSSVHNRTLGGRQAAGEWPPAGCGCHPGFEGLDRSQEKQSSLWSLGSKGSLGDAEDRPPWA